MSEYIKKEDAIRHFQSFEKIMKSMPLADVKARLKDLPPADVRPNIHGHWIDKMNDYLGYVTHCECSECGYTVRKAYAVEYIGCPYCLADMREPKPIGVFKRLNDSVTGEPIQDMREPKGEKGET